MADQRSHIRLTGREKVHDYTRPPAEAERLSTRLRAIVNGTRNVYATSSSTRANPRSILASILGLLVPSPMSCSRADSRSSSRWSAAWIELLNVVHETDRVRATVRIPADRFNVVDAIFERYATEEQKSGRPKNQRLVESIDRIRLATRQDFWTDMAPFPEADEEIWWEVWLPHPNNRHPQETRDEFAAEAQIAGLLTRQRYVTFPDRVVVLVYGALEKWRLDRDSSS